MKHHFSPFTHTSSMCKILNVLGFLLSFQGFANCQDLAVAPMPNQAEKIKIAGTEIAPAGILPNTVYQIQSATSSKMFNVKDGSVEAGAGVLQNDNNGSKAQQFTFVPLGNDFYNIITSSGLYLSVVDHFQLSTTNGSIGNSMVLIQDKKYRTGGPPCGRSVTDKCPYHQSWKLISARNNAYIIQSAAFFNPNFVLQPNNNNALPSIVLEQSAGTNNQRWTIAEPGDWALSPNASQAEILNFREISAYQMGVAASLENTNTKPFYFHHRQPNEEVYKYKKKILRIPGVFNGTELDAWFPVEEHRKTICGIIKEYKECAQNLTHNKFANPDKDVNMHIVPDPKFAYLLNNPLWAEHSRKKGEVYNKSTDIEVEFTPSLSGSAYRNPVFNYTSNSPLKAMEGTNDKVCAFGPWMWERLLAFKIPLVGTVDAHVNNEIHPANQIWYKKGNETQLISIVDESGYFQKTGNDEVEASGLNQVMRYYVAFEIPNTVLNAPDIVKKIDYNILSVGFDFTNTVSPDQRLNEVFSFKFGGNLRFQVTSNSATQKNHKISFDKIRKRSDGSIQGYIVVDTEPITIKGGSINVTIRNTTN